MLSIGDICEYRQRANHWLMVRIDLLTSIGYRVTILNPTELRGEITDVPTSDTNKLTKIKNLGDK
jgi:hypothetical protein